MVLGIGSSRRFARRVESIEKRFGIFIINRDVHTHTHITQRYTDMGGVAAAPCVIISSLVLYVS